jgi:hypothetical protein
VFVDVLAEDDEQGWVLVQVVEQLDVGARKLATDTPRP